MVIFTSQPQENCWIKVFLVYLCLKACRRVDIVKSMTTEWAESFWRGFSRQRYNRKGNCATFYFIGYVTFREKKFLSREKFKRKDFCGFFVSIIKSSLRASLEATQREFLFLNIFKNKSWSFLDFSLLYFYSLPVCVCLVAQIFVPSLRSKF